MRVDSDRTRGNDFKLRQEAEVRYEEEALHVAGGNARRLWMPHPWRHSRPGWMWLWAAWLLVGDPAHSRGLELDDHCGPFQPRPFCGSVTFYLKGNSAKQILLI